MKKKKSVENNNNNNFNNSNSFEIKQKFELNDAQKQIIETGLDSKNCRCLIIDGRAGSSKTYLATLIALILLKEKKANLLTYIRTSVQSKDGELGFLSGSLEDKTAWMNEPFFSKLDELISKSTTDKLFKEKKVQTIPSSMLRGLNLSGVTIFDECNNALFSTIETALTRISEHSLIILCGDSSGSQNDLGNKSGFKKVIEIFNGDEECRKNGLFYFKLNSDSIVRSKFVKFVVKRLESIDKK